MPSGKSVIYFISINTLFASLGTLDYYIYTDISPFLLFFPILLKYLLVYWSISYASQSRPYITEAFIKRDTSLYSNALDILSTSLFNFFMTLLIARYFSVATVPYNEYVFFIPNTFVYEIGFDFFHYVSHRALHSVPFIYRLTHKYHHQDHRISVVTTFHHSLADLILTNLFPLVCISYLYPLPLRTYFIWSWFKTLVEMGGHSGKYGKSSSFPQCVWIPKALGIEMYADNHNKHHTNPEVNFSKRFALWDKIFGTFRDGIYN